MHYRIHPVQEKPNRFGSRAASVQFGVAIVMIVTLCSAGCVTDAIRSTWQPYGAMKKRTAIKWRASRQAKQVWNENYKKSYASSPSVADMKSGYVSAYVETAMGMGECPPPVPIHALISPHTIKHSYPVAVPWYQGYSFGHADAVARGVDRWRLAPLNPDLTVAMCRCQADAATLESTPFESIQIDSPAELPPSTEAAVEEIHADELLPENAESWR